MEWTPMVNAMLRDCSIILTATSKYFLCPSWPWYELWMFWALFMREEDWIELNQTKNWNNEIWWSGSLASLFLFFKWHLTLIHQLLVTGETIIVAVDAFFMLLLIKLKRGTIANPLVMIEWIWCTRNQCETLTRFFPLLENSLMGKISTYV